MKHLIKEAYVQGQRAAARDLGVKIADLDPNEAAWLSLLPGSSLAMAATAPEGRRMSRALHHIVGESAGGSIGGISGAVAGTAGGLGLGALISLLTRGHVTRPGTIRGGSVGLLLGGLGGGLYGAHRGAEMGQEYSQDSDPEDLKLKRLLQGG